MNFQLRNQEKVAGLVGVLIVGCMDGVALGQSFVSLKSISKISKLAKNMITLLNKSSTYHHN